MPPTYHIDGRHTTSLDAFYDVVERELLGGQAFGRNMDALDDVLRGEFGPLPATFALVWDHAAAARDALGYAETVRQLERRLAQCHPTNRPQVARELAAAARGEGPTVFDWLVALLRSHANVTLTLADAG